MLLILKYQVGYKMSEPSNIEELKKRKEQLLLEQEVARLERKQNLAKSGDWAWWWVAALALVGAFLLLLGVKDGGAPVLLLPALLALAPIVMKLYFKRG